MLTPALKEYIREFLNGEPVSSIELSPKEHDYIKSVFKIVGIIKHKPITEDDLRMPKQKNTKKYLRDRFKVLLGEMSAGNDGKAVCDRRCLDTNADLPDGRMTYLMYASIPCILSPVLLACAGVHCQSFIPVGLRSPVIYSKS
ncbi:MAG: hypothetical protein P4M14_06055, partial [Gammaproteobacteria bacterium]|nr:hypothetical protein [Gammaproteobacteria bacterium]